MENPTSDLHDFLGSHGYHPYKKWNQTLNDWCKSFIDSLADYNELRTNCSFTSYYGKTELEIKLAPHNYAKSFKAVVVFAPSEEGCFSLQMKYTTAYDFGKERQEEADYYIWKEEELTEFEIREERYVMEMLKNRFKDFIKWRESLDVRAIMEQY